MKAKAIREEWRNKYGAYNVSFKSSDEIELQGMLITRSKPKGLMILCHGYRSNKEALSDLIDMFPYDTILLFDFRAHGQSAGNITTIGCKEYRDIIGASHFLQKKGRELYGKKYLPVSILGVSMGAAATLKAVAHDPSICDALIIDSSYADLWEVVHQSFTQHSGLPSYPFIPVMESMLASFADCQFRQMKPVEQVRSINKPILFIHARGDAHTSSADSVRLFREAQNSQSKLWLAASKEHAGVFKDEPDTYATTVRDFMKATFARFKKWHKKH